MLRVYVRQLLVFPFPVRFSRDDARVTLTAGLFATLKQFPFLAGTVAQTDLLTGAMAVRYPKSISAEVASQMLTTQFLDTDALDYNTLNVQGVQPSQLPSDVFCPLALRSHPGLDDPYAEGLISFKNGEPLPAFAAQINFIPGGLILSAYTHHSVVDGTGIAKIYQTWSGHTRTYSPETEESTQADAISLNNARHAFDSLIVDAPIMKLPEFRYPGDPINLPLREHPYEVDAKLLVFPATTISRLATLLSAATKKRISTFNALTALIWCQITNARRAAMVEKGIAKTTVGIAVDHRKRVGTLLPSDYIGNCANGMTVSVPLSSIPTTDNMNSNGIAPVALTLLDALNEIDLEWLKTRLSQMSKQPNSSELLLNVDTRNGPDIFLTSWMHIGADDVWNLVGRSNASDGSGWSCKPTAIRKPQNTWEGGMQILPRQKGDIAPYEIMVYLEKDEMERTIQALQEGKWVERVVQG